MDKYHIEVYRIEDGIYAQAVRLAVAEYRRLFRATPSTLLLPARNRPAVLLELAAAGMLAGEGRVTADNVTLQIGRYPAGMAAVQVG